MFDSFRDKLLSVVQDGINLNNTVRRKISKVQQTKYPPNFTPDTINYSVGSDLLDKYQKDWAELHENAERNAQAAENIDVIMSNMQENVKGRMFALNRINTALSGLPQTINAVDDCVSRLKSLNEKFESVETELIGLEALIEKCDFQHRKMEHRFQLNMYKETKFAALEHSRVALAQKQAEKAREAEVRQRELLKERQKAASQAFQEDIALYKAQGELPKKLSFSKNIDKEPTLEEIQLDTGDTAELDEFLGK